MHLLDDAVVDDGEEKFFQIERAHANLHDDLRDLRLVVNGQNWWLLDLKALARNYEIVLRKFLDLTQFLQDLLLHFDLFAFLLDQFCYSRFEVVNNLELGFLLPQVYLVVDIQIINDVLEINKIIVLLDLLDLDSRGDVLAYLNRVFDRR